MRATSYPQIALRAAPSSMDYGPDSGMLPDQIDHEESRGGALFNHVGSEHSVSAAAIEVLHAPWLHPVVNRETACRLILARNIIRHEIGTISRVRLSYQCIIWYYSTYFQISPRTPRYSQKATPTGLFHSI